MSIYYQQPRSSSSSAHPINPSLSPKPHSEYWGRAGRFGNHHKLEDPDHRHLVHDPATQFQHEQMLSKSIQPRAASSSGFGFGAGARARDNINLAPNPVSNFYPGTKTVTNTSSKISRTTPLFQPRKEDDTYNDVSAPISSRVAPKNRYFFPQQQQQQRSSSAVTFQKQQHYYEDPVVDDNFNVSSGFNNTNISNFINERSSSAPIFTSTTKPSATTNSHHLVVSTSSSSNRNQESVIDPLLSVLEQYSDDTKHEIDEELRHLQEMESKFEQLKEAVRRGKFEKLQRQEKEKQLEEERIRAVNQQLAVVNKMQRLTNENHSQQHHFHNNHHNHSHDPPSPSWLKLKNEVKAGGVTQTNVPIQNTYSPETSPVFHGPSPQKEIEKNDDAATTTSSSSSVDSSPPSSKKETDNHTHHHEVSSPPAHLLQDDDDNDENENENNTKNSNNDNNIFSPPPAVVDIEDEGQTTLDMQTCAEGLVKYAIRQHELQRKQERETLMMGSSPDSKNNSPQKEKTQTEEGEQKRSKNNNNQTVSISTNKLVGNQALQDAARFHPLLQKKHAKQQLQQQQQQQNIQKKNSIPSSETVIITSEEDETRDNNNSKKQSRRNNNNYHQQQQPLVLYQAGIASLNAAETEYVKKDANILIDDCWLSTLAHVSARLLTEHKCMARILIELNKRLILEAIMKTKPSSLLSSAMPPLSPRRQ